MSHPLLGCLASALALLLALSACNQQKQSQPKPAAQEAAFDASQIIAQANAGLQNAQLRRDLLYIIGADPVEDIQVLPTVPPWKISCGGLGIKITFWPSAAPDAAITVQLLERGLSDVQCEQVMFPVASKAKAHLTLPSR